MKNIFLAFITTITLSATYAQVGINADNSVPHSSSMLDVKSTTKAFYPPRMTTAQKNAIASVQVGATVFDITLNQLSYYNGSAWVAAAGGGLTLPYSQTQSQFTGYDGGLFKVTNSNPNGDAVALNGTITGTDGFAIRAMATNTTGFNTGAIYATNSSTNSNGYGISGSHAGGGTGVTGSSISGIGVSGNSTTSIGISANGQTMGVQATSISGAGVSGQVLGANGFGVIGIANGAFSTGARGESSDSDGKGVYGYATGTRGIGVRGFSALKTGVQAESNNGIGLYASSVNNYAIITGNGNVGIGVSDPTTILDVKSRIRIRHGAETSGVYFDGTGNTYKSFIGMETDNLFGIYGFNGAGWSVKMDNTTGELLASKGLSIGGGSKIGKIIRYSINWNISNVSANSFIEATFEVPDAQTGDQVMVNAVGNLAPMVIGNCYVVLPGYVSIFFVNNSNVDVDPPMLTYNFTLIR
ncbi:MAG: hypothetical protein V4683_03180 [Bacteroidota bacterium]